jgi:L-seryl-tRNA(Ser) seleniumtransferase
MDLSPFGLHGEPTARDAVKDGASLVLMSGDKLLGGPQAGIILGRKSVLEKLRKNPLARALRVDKLTLAALEATVSLYRDPATARRDIPVLAMITANAGVLRPRADKLAARLTEAGRTAHVVSSEGSVGGGAFPTAVLPGWAVALEGNAEAIEAKLRGGRLPVIARVHDGRLQLDVRTILERDDDALAVAVLNALADSAA